MSVKKLNMYLALAVLEILFLAFVVPKMISAKSDWVVVIGFGLLGLNILAGLNFLFFKYIESSTRNVETPSVTPQEAQAQTKSN